MVGGNSPEWDDEVRAGVPAQHGQVDDFLAGLPPGYRDRTPPTEAVEDLALLAELATEKGPQPEPAGGPVALGGEHRLAVRPPDEEGYTFRMRRLGPVGMELTSALPLLESFGLVVVEVIPYRFTPQAGASLPPTHIDDIAVRIESPFGPEAIRFVPGRHGPRLVEAVEACSAGLADVDTLNHLVTAAALDWRQVTVLRAYLRYWRQTGGAASWDEMVEPLVEYPDVARALVAYFQARFDPVLAVDGAASPAAGERALCIAQLDLVRSLDRDRVLRGVLALIDATLRTNFYRTPLPSGRPLVLKLRSDGVPGLAPPRPLVEAFVHGSTVEGIHLRAGLIARGGLRWSERPDDFRTEVLDLAFAQVKKNAIIVPTGAKGGFLPRSPAASHPALAPRSRPSFDQVRDAYRLFVSGLLEVTDDIEGGEVVAPEGVVPADGPDPYLVVAADKGTATFSDLANSLSEGQGFWLGDAFASGGSRGYDHKAMGITAKGAWVSVRRHFRELGVDVAVDPISVAGVGDMSGDVFGNGMLLSTAIKLVAAFDHRHVFIDPDPDPRRSFEERRRLATLAASSWDDYDRSVLSDGGGVWSRDTKLVPLSPAARRVLGVTQEAMSPPRLISAILGSPVDLLWFGGIGTYIKAPDEADADVGDHANDALRITSDDVRARVIAEGANLGVTQKARIRYSRRGGRINADFIDNAAGVATSDREVNLKILLALASERGRLNPASRDSYLDRSENEVAAEVLRQVDHSVAALNRAAADSERLLDAYESVIDSLETAGRINREVEVLPDAAEFSRRRSAGAGLIRPELATVLAYAKSDLVAAIEQSAVPADPFFADSAIEYFPAPILADFADLVPDHRLYRQLVATGMAGEVVDQMGIVWAHDLSAELDVGLDRVAAAFWVARRVTGAAELWAELESGVGVDAFAEAELHRWVATAVGELTRRYLLEPDFQPLKAAERDGAADRTDDRDRSPDGPDATVAVPEQLPGVPAAVAERFTRPRRHVRNLLVDRIARAADRPGSDAALALAAVERAAAIDELSSGVITAMEASSPPGRLRLWQARAALDDLRDFSARAAVSALASPGSDARSAVEGWVTGNRTHLDGARLLLAARTETTDPLAVASLALRRLNRITAR